MLIWSAIQIAPAGAEDFRRHEALYRSIREAVARAERQVEKGDIATEAAVARHRSGRYPISLLREPNLKARKLILDGLDWLDLMKLMRYRSRFLMASVGEPGAIGPDYGSKLPAEFYSMAAGYGEIISRTIDRHELLEATFEAAKLLNLLAYIAQPPGSFGNIDPFAANLGAGHDRIKVAYEKVRYAMTQMITFQAEDLKLDPAAMVAELQKPMALFNFRLSRGLQMSCIYSLRGY